MGWNPIDEAKKVGKAVSGGVKKVSRSVSKAAKGISRAANTVGNAVEKTRQVADVATAIGKLGENPMDIVRHPIVTGVARQALQTAAPVLSKHPLGMVALSAADYGLGKLEGRPEEPEEEVEEEEEATVPEPASTGDMKPTPVNMRMPTRKFYGGPSMEPDLYDLGQSVLGYAREFAARQQPRGYMRLARAVGRAIPMYGPPNRYMLEDEF